MEETDTLRQALEKMEHHGYAAVPLLSTEGKYLGTLTDGDVLWGLKKLNFPSLYQMEEIPVMQVNRSRDNKPVHVDVDMEGLLEDGPLKGYFAWSCATDGTRNSQGPASDGELYYVTALIFASNRWGNDTGINYLAEAQNILNCSMEKDGTNRVMPFINVEHKLITFVPDIHGGRFTDPSYHVPAFYEVWARWANDGRADFWRECAERSREYLHKSIHPVTGLNPDYNNYDGSLLGNNRIIGDAFRFDGHGG